jgi:cytosine/adenosine deaminase-related metal-dependent hydrolase
VPRKRTNFEAKILNKCVFHKTPTVEGDVMMPAGLAVAQRDRFDNGLLSALCDAVAIKGDRIIRVGTNVEVNKLIGKNTRVIRLRGKTLIPGLIDTYIHVADFGRFLTWIDLRDVDFSKKSRTVSENA